MANPSKSKGTRYETQVVNTINDWAGSEMCERVALHGNRDEGDIRLAVRDMVLAVECKWSKKYPNKAEEKEFREQTDTEALNAGADGGILVVNRYRNGIERHEVWMHLSLAARICDSEPPKRGSNPWVCTRLYDFCWVCFGPPSWENRRGII